MSVIQAQVQQLVVGCKQPGAVVLCEATPKIASGKILRRVIRARCRAVKRGV
jgi:acyl-coenzyme A synthetase/AMP-(fatty) acid ligase